MKDFPTFALLFGIVAALALLASLLAIFFPASKCGLFVNALSRIVNAIVVRPACGTLRGFSELLQSPSTPARVPAVGVDEVLACDVATLASARDFVERAPVTPDIEKDRATLRRVLRSQASGQILDQLSRWVFCHCHARMCEAAKLRGQQSPTLLRTSIHVADWLRHEYRDKCCYGHDTGDLDQVCSIVSLRGDHGLVCQSFNEAIADPSYKGVCIPNVRAADLRGAYLCVDVRTAAELTHVVRIEGRPTVVLNLEADTPHAFDKQECTPVLERAAWAIQQLGDELYGEIFPAENELATVFHEDTNRFELDLVGVRSVLVRVAQAFRQVVAFGKPDDVCVTVIATGTGNIWRGPHLHAMALADGLDVSEFEEQYGRYHPYGGSITARLLAKASQRVVDGQQLRPILPAQVDATAKSCVPQRWDHKYYAVVPVLEPSGAPSAVVCLHWLGSQGRDAAKRFTPCDSYHLHRFARALGSYLRHDCRAVRWNEMFHGVAAV